ncbi:MAG: hypothetical protein IKV48_05960 [Eggerthellaceae bacterium]|nr:hypothetical protein [Eggerthellaceae bacterium]
METVNATLNVLAEIVVTGKATDPLLEHLEMRRVAKDVRKPSLFDGERGPRIFVETAEYLGCPVESLFMTYDAALRRIFNWVRDINGRGCRLSCSMASDASSVAYKLHIELRDRSSLRIRMEFDMHDPRHPVLRKCELKMRRSNAAYFISPFIVSNGMRQSPTAFLQCIRECAEFGKIQSIAQSIIDEGFLNHVYALPKRKTAWTEETYVDYDKAGRAHERKIRTAAYGAERYEYELSDRDEECMSLRCGEYFKCMFKRPCTDDYRLAEIVFKGELGGEQQDAPVKTVEGRAAESQSRSQSAFVLAQKGKVSESDAEGLASKLEREKSGQEKSAAAPLCNEEEVVTRYRFVELSDSDVLARNPEGSVESHVHAFERVDANVEVRRSIARTEIRRITAYYCPTCRVYLLAEAAYSALKEGDRLICCKVIEVDDGGRNRLMANRGKGERHFNEESLLHSYGYNVGKKDNLTTAQRQMILTHVVDRGIMRPDQAIGFLRYLIDRSKPRKADMSSAIGSWEADIRFLEGLRKRR